MKNLEGYSNLVPMVMAVVITFALLFAGTFINGTIKDEFQSSSTNDDANSTMDNISADWDNSLDIVQITIIITILAGAIGAIFLFTRFKR